MFKKPKPYLNNNHLVDFLLEEPLRHRIKQTALCHCHITKANCRDTVILPKKDVTYIFSCNDQFQYFWSVVNGIIGNYLPLKRMKSDSSDKPWITLEIKSLISRRQKQLGPEVMCLCFGFTEIKVTYCAGAPAQGFKMITLLTHCNQVVMHTWWSNVKNIASLVPKPSPSTVIYNGQSFSDTDLADTLNENFVHKTPSILNASIRKGFISSTLRGRKKC